MTDEITTKRRALLRSVFDGLHELGTIAKEEKDTTSLTAIKGSINTILITYSDRDIVGTCEECGIVLFREDLGHICADGEPIFCAKHAYTWAEIKAQWDEDETDGNSDKRSEFMASYEEHISDGGSPDDKVLHTL